MTQSIFNNSIKNGFIENCGIQTDFNLRTALNQVSVSLLLVGHIHLVAVVSQGICIWCWKPPILFSIANLFNTCPHLHVWVPTKILETTAIHACMLHYYCRDNGNGWWLSNCHHLISVKIKALKILSWKYSWQRPEVLLELFLKDPRA